MEIPHVFLSKYGTCKRSVLVGSSTISFWGESQGLEDKNHPFSSGSFSRPPFIKLYVWANYNDLSPPVGHLKWWWIVRESLPTCPKHSGLGIIVICPDMLIWVLVSEIVYFHLYTWGNDPIWRAYFWNGLKPQPHDRLAGISLRVVATSPTTPTMEDMEVSPKAARDV